MATTVLGITSRHYNMQQQKIIISFFCVVFWKARKPFPCVLTELCLSSLSLFTRYFFTDALSHTIGASWVTHLTLIKSLTTGHRITTIGLASHTGDRVLFSDGWLAEQNEDFVSRERVGCLLDRQPTHEFWTLTVWTYSSHITPRALSSSSVKWE